MDILMMLLAFLICFNFILKQTENAPVPILVVGLVCFFFVGFSWPWAIEQSGSKIAEWMSDPSLLTDLTVILTIDVFLQMLFCWDAESGMNALPEKKGWKLVSHCFLKWFPGILFFPVLFALLVWVIFSFPGYSFPLLSWSLSILIVTVFLLGIWMMRILFPDRELRLELLYQTNWLVAVLGFIATINGQSTVTGISNVDWMALAVLFLLLLFFGLCGWGWYRFSILRFKEKNKKL